jgi:four helix bundle protein
MRRASVSIPSNIAEGCGRAGDADFARFLQIALGSASELEYQLILAHDLGWLTTVEFTQLTESVIEVKRMLGGFIRKLRG